MVLHSRSFLNCDQNGFYSSPNDDAVSKFDLLLATLANKVSLVTTADVASLISDGIAGDVMEYSHNVKMDCAEVAAITPIAATNKTT